MAGWHIRDVTVRAAERRLQNVVLPRDVWHHGVFSVHRSFAGQHVEKVEQLRRVPRRG